MILTVVLLALGNFFFVNLVKSLVKVRVLAPAKLIVVLMLATAEVAFFVSTGREFVLLLGGVAGTSTMFHALHRALISLGDYGRIMAMRNAPRR